MASTSSGSVSQVVSSLGGVQVQNQPFPHFVVERFFDDETAEALLEWLEAGASWSVEARSFYIQHGCSGVTERLTGTPAAVAGSRQVFDTIRTHLERVFGANLSHGHVELAAHRLLPGHRIGIHNDCPANGTETHRLVVNLNRGFDDENGGHLVLVDINDPAQTAIVVRPLHNSAVAMEFSDHSWHCVEEVRAGQRYSLLYSFWPAETSGESTEQPHSAPSIPESAIKAAAWNDCTALLQELGANSTLIDHLIETYRILERWQCDADVCKAGLFHSVLDTPGPSEAQVGQIRQLIGERAFLLVRLFSTATWSSLEKMLDKPVYMEAAMVGDVEIGSLATLLWANARQQYAGAPRAGDEMVNLTKLYAATRHLLLPQGRADIAAFLQDRNHAGPPNLLLLL